MGTEESAYPAKLQRIVDYFSSLDEQTRRSRLIEYAEQAEKWYPDDSDKILLEDLRNDEECLDEVGIYIVEQEGTISFRLYFGDDVQILTKAMGVILSKGLQKTMLDDIINLPSQVVTDIIGRQLVRNRSQTVFYIMNRMKWAAKQLNNGNRG